MMTDDQPNTNELHRIADMGIDMPADNVSPTPDRFGDGSVMEQQAYEMAFRGAKAIVDGMQSKKELEQLQSEGEEKDAIIGLHEIEKADLEYKATHDRQTDILNRAAFLEQASRRIGHVRRREDRGRKHTLAICDLDNFKGVNDTYGHSGGDEVLDKTVKVLVSQLHQAIREGLISDGLVCRFGGDELSLLLQDAPRESSEKVLKRIQKLVNAISIREKRGIGLTIGAIEADQGARVSDMLDEADTALYKGKRTNGKNQVIFVNPNGDDEDTGRRQGD